VRPNTITNKKALRDELDQVAEAGFTVNDEEFAPEPYLRPPGPPPRR